MKAMQKAVLETAKDLLKANNTITTLEIKTELRRVFPYFYWTQQTVSDYMAGLAGDGVFDFTDNGTYRTYSLAAPISVPTTNTAPRVVTTPKKVASKSVAPVAVAKTPKSKKLSVQEALDVLTALTNNTDFDYAQFHDGRHVGRGDIKAQKKSPKAFFTANKLKEVRTLCINNKEYTIK